MPSCLGLYIEKNVIKYAKLSKDHDNIRIDSFGMKFYDNFNETLKQVVSETYSYKTPISVNLLDEKYTYANLFSLLNKKDLEKAVETEFDFFCNETGKNHNAIEYRRLLIPNLEDKDKITSLYVYTDKSNLVGKIQALDGYKTTNVVPLPISISNLNTFVDKKNCVIINIEKNTSVTTIVNGQVHKVDLIEDGMGNIFDSIIEKENSYAKAYEICKNSTIYTTQGKNLQIEENEYMEDIMPVLYRVVEQVKEIVKANQIEIGEIYITGLAAAINNIDLYFQENFVDKKCEILTPFFINKSNVKLNIKDYIEVNSAISLALQGLGIGPKDINFKNKGKFDQLSGVLSSDVSRNKDKSAKEPKKHDIKDTLKNSFSKSLDNLEKSIIYLGTLALIIVVMYSISSKMLTSEFNKKETELKEFITDAETKISKVYESTQIINGRTEEYNEILEKVDENNQKLTETTKRKNAIPNLLTALMSNIPKEVQLLNVRNSTGKTIKIEAQSAQYEQLGYFIAKIKNEGILTDVTSTSGVMQDEVIKITIEGNLPY